MADTSVRKSGRARKRTSYLEDDFKFDYDIDFDVSGNISNILDSQAKQRKAKENPPKRKKVYPNIDKNLKLGAGTVNGDEASVATNVEGNGSVLKHHSNGAERPVEDVSDSSASLPGKLGTEDEQLSDGSKKAKGKTGEMTAPRSGGHACEVCDKVCVDMAAYKRHMKCHSGDRKYKCEICDKAFIDSCSLKRHWKIHGDERPFTCDLCFKSFRDGPSLSRHQQTHIDRPRLFTCKTCDKSFADKHGLTRHERTHTGLRPFECPVCHKTFSESGSFKRHEKIHIGIRKFACIVCDKRFLEKQSLLRHQRVVCGVTSDTTKTVSQVDFPPGGSGDNSNTSFTSLDNSGAPSSLGEYASTTSPSADRDTPENLKRPKTSSIAKANGSALDGEPSSSTVSGEGPSLQSLMRKDPNLYAGISDLVESIDSYEQMLNLCGDGGHSQIDAALTRSPPPMPDNLLCFECGEHLVDGENFSKEGKVFSTEEDKNQFRCLSCEEGDAVDYGDPPVLTAGVPPPEESDFPSEEAQVLGSDSRKDKEEVNTSQVVENVETGSKDGDESNAPPSEKLVPGMDKSLEYFRERLQAQHGVYFLGEMYPHLLSSFAASHEDTDSTTATSTNASVSRSSSTEESDPYSQDFEPKVTFQSETSDNTTSLAPGSQQEGDSGENQMPKDVHEGPPSSGSPTAGQAADPLKLEYATEDSSIPSVFPCHLCTKVFATSAFLSRHLALHRNSPHKCMVCGKTFTNAASLKRHMTTHTGEKPYACPVCSKRFRDPSNFCKHKKICIAPANIPSPADSASPVASPLKPGERSAPLATKVRSTPGRPKKRAPHSDQASRSPQSERRDSPAVELTGGRDCEQTRRPGVKISDGDEESKMPSPVPLTSPTIHFSYDDVGDDDDDEEEDANLSVTFAQPPGAALSQTGDDDNDDDEADVPVTFEKPPQGLASTHVLDDNVDLPVALAEHAQGLTSVAFEHSADADETSLMGTELSESGEFPGGSSLLQDDGREAETSVACEICDRMFPKEKDLQRHMRFHSSENPELTCEECGKSFSDSSGLKRHMRIHADTRPHVCEFCHRGYCDNWSLRKHQSRGCLFSELQVEARLMVPCPQCTRLFGTEELQKEHIVTVHKGALKFECDVCHKRFSEAFNLKRHRRLHIATCPLCGREFMDVKLLVEHQERDCPATGDVAGPTSTGEKFTCSECGAMYSTKANLERHKKTHLGLKPHVCEVCNKRFSEGFKLKRHMKVHSESKPYTCHNCKKGFSYMQGLKQHLLKTKCRSSSNTNTLSLIASTPKQQAGTPTSRRKQRDVDSPLAVAASPGATEFPCEMCGKVFQKKFLLVRHMNVHSVERPYTCGQCGRAYKDTSSLKRHLLVHKGVKEFVCPDCGKGFFYSDSLRRHRNGLCGRISQSTGQGLGPASGQDGQQGRRRGRKGKPRHIDMVNNNRTGLSPGSEVDSTLMEFSPGGAGEETGQPGQAYGAWERGFHQDGTEEPVSPAALLPRCPIRLPSRMSHPTGPWSCIKGRYCWRCTAYFPSPSLLLEHARVHRHRKPYPGRSGFHRWSRKMYFTAEEKARGLSPQEASSFQLNLDNQARDTSIMVNNTDHGSDSLLDGGKGDSW